MRVELSSSVFLLTLQKKLHQGKCFPLLVRNVVAYDELVFVSCCRAQLKGQILMSLETSEGLLEAMGAQALADGSYQSPEEISKNIDNVSLTDVANVRHMVLFSALSLLGC